MHQSIVIDTRSLTSSFHANDRIIRIRDSRGRVVRLIVEALRAGEGLKRIRL